MSSHTQDPAGFFSGLGATPTPSSTNNTNTLMTALIRDVTLRSQFTPSYTWTPQTQTSTQGGLTDIIMRMIKPSADVRLPTGAVIQVAPWGAPTSNYFPLVALAFLAAGVVVAGGLISIGRKLG